MLEPGRHFVIQITEAELGKNQQGKPLVCIEGILEELNQKLRHATWELDATTGHPKLCGGPLEISCGKFEAHFDKRRGTDGTDTAPCVYFLPVEQSWLSGISHLIVEHLVCHDDREIERAHSAKPPPANDSRIAKS